MRLTRTQLRRLINEEARLLKEAKDIRPPVLAFFSQGPGSSITFAPQIIAAYVSNDSVNSAINDIVDQAGNETDKLSKEMQRWVNKNKQNFIKTAKKTASSYAWLSPIASIVKLID